MGGRIWTRQDDDELILRLAKGETYEQIGRALNRSEKGVIHRAVRINLKDAKQAAGRSGERKAWSPAEDATLLELRNTGATIEQIEKRLGHPRSSIYKRLAKLGRLETPEQTTMTYEAPELKRDSIDELTNRLDEQHRLIKDLYNRVANLAVSTGNVLQEARRATAFCEKSPAYRATHKLNRKE